MYTHKLQEKLQHKIIQSFQNKELISKIFNVLDNIKRSKFGSTSIVFIDENYFSIKLISQTNNFANCSFDFYDDFYDIFICEEEFFIQRKMPSISKVCNQIEELLSNKITESTINTKKGSSFRKDISFSFNGKNETIGTLDLKNIFAKKILIEKEYQSWLCNSEN